MLIALTASQQMVGWCEAAAWRLISPGSETAVSLQSLLTCDDGLLPVGGGTPGQMLPCEV